jgi:hypothetical protein
MTIEIDEPELEALIQERMKSGHFQSVEEVLIQALKAAPPAMVSSSAANGHTGADLIAAMQASPHKEVDLEPVRVPLPVRGVTL